MTKKESKQLEEGKIYQAMYKDYSEYYKIMFIVKSLTTAGTKSKLYIETPKNKYVDLVKNEVKNTHCLNWLGVLDISKIKDLKELQTS